MRLRKILAIVPMAVLLGATAVLLFGTALFALCYPVYYINTVAQEVHDE